MSRGRYEFPKRVKDDAHSKWHANNPGREDESLEVDHIVPVWYAKKNHIPPDLVRVGNNARALTVKEHKERHRNEPTEEEYKTLAQAILGWVRNLI